MTGDWNHLIGPNVHRFRGMRLILMMVGESVVGESEKMLQARVLAEIFAALHQPTAPFSIAAKQT